MYTRSIISFILCLCFIYSYGQEYNFSLGVSSQAFIYKNFNKSDWNNRPGSFPNNPANFNGLSLGLTFAKPLNDHFAIRFEPGYSSQFQRHKLSRTVDADTLPNDGIDYYSRDLETTFDIIKFPIMISYTTEIGYESGLYVSVYFGGQISFVSNYDLEYREYYYDPVTKEIDRDFLFDLIVRKPHYTYQKFWSVNINPPGYTENKFATDFFYNRWLLGTLGGFEIQKSIGTYLMIGLGARVEYDFTNSEKHPELTLGGLGGLGNSGPRAKSHNLRYGFSFSTSYLFL